MQNITRTYAHPAPGASNRTECVFCKDTENTERQVAENDLSWAFLTNRPIVSGHVLICPKRCVASIDSLTSDELLSLMELRDVVTKGLRRVCDAKGFNYAWNEGEMAGQTVPHLHLHIVPRSPGDAGIYRYEPRRFLYRPGSRSPKSLSDLRTLCDTIRQAIYLA